MYMPVPVVVQSEMKLLATWLLRLLVWMLLRAWMFVPCLYMICCPKQRPCDELIIFPGSPAVW